MWTLLFNFEGRINRAKYWTLILLVSLVSVVWLVLCSRVVVAWWPELPKEYWPTTEREAFWQLFLIFGILGIPAWWIILAAAVKRCHDRGKPAIWILISLIPIVGNVWYFIETGLLRGTVGPNKYGPDPLEPVHPAGAASNQAAVPSVTSPANLPTANVTSWAIPPAIGSVAPEIDTSFWGYCPGCRKARNSSTRQCNLCGSWAPVPSPPQPSEVADKYALMLKYSDKARAVEARLSKLPHDLRERFKREAVSYPDRIEAMADALLAELQRRGNPFGDPKLDALYEKLEVHGPQAQAEFQRVLEFLKGQVDPEKVFAQINDEQTTKSKSTNGEGAQTLSQEPETAVRDAVAAEALSQAKARRLAALQAKSTENLLHEFEKLGFITTYKDGIMTLTKGGIIRSVYSQRQLAEILDLQTS